MPKPSLFITFEGGEGSGKSTQSQRLYERLITGPAPVILTHEPGGTPLGEKIMELLKWAKDIQIDPTTELLLFNASRSQLVNTVIRPHLETGRIVLCDRYAESSLAYQGYARGINLDLVKEGIRLATGGLRPDLIVLVDVPVETGFRRKREDKPDRFEQENSAFHERVRQGYLKMAREEPSRWLVLDGAGSVEQVWESLWNRVSQMAAERFGK